MRNKLGQIWLPIRSYGIAPTQASFLRLFYALASSYYFSALNNTIECVYVALSQYRKCQMLKMVAILNFR
jgi:hypothetical protein